MAADSVALLFQGQGTPHFLRRGGGRCSLPSLWDRCAHVEAWDVHRGTHADSPGHVGHTTYLETLLGNIRTHGHTGPLLTHRCPRSDILDSHLAYLAYRFSPTLKSFPLFSKSELAFGFDVKKKKKTSGLPPLLTQSPSSQPLATSHSGPGWVFTEWGSIWHKEMLRRHLVVTPHNCGSGPLSPPHS